MLTVFASGTGDANGDGPTDGGDINAFIDLVINNPVGPPSPETCGADFSGDGTVGVEDIEDFVLALLN